VDAISRKRPQTTFVRVPDAPAANVLSVNETVLVRSSSEFPRSVPILQRACQIAGLASVEVEGSELAKIDGALTCGSVLLY
jgi:dimethylargininase